MTEDLEAIDVLSNKFSDAVKQGRRYESTDALILIDNSPLIAQGHKVLRMYEAEAAKAPDDFDVKASMAEHLYRMGWMYYDAVIPSYLHRTSGAGDLVAAAVRDATQSCNFMVRSYQLVPNSGAAFVLADLFRLAGFYGTSIFWLEKAEKISTDFDDATTATKAKAQKLDLQADGKTIDPQLSRKMLFPAANTPGLITANQSSTPAASIHQANTSVVPANYSSTPSSPAIQQGKQPDMGWIRNGAITAGVGVLLGVLYSPLGIFNLITLVGVVLIIVGFVKGRPA